MKDPSLSVVETKRKTLKRAASVPSDLLPIIRKRIPGEVAVRAAAQTAKANNASGLVCLELYTKHNITDHEQRLRDHEQRMRAIESLVYRRVA